MNLGHQVMTDIQGGCEGSFLQALISLHAILALCLDAVREDISCHVAVQGHFNTA
jgi:hypothetical protein